MVECEHRNAVYFRYMSTGSAAQRHLQAVRAGIPPVRLSDDDRSLALYAVIEIDDVLVHQADTAG